MKSSGDRKRFPLLDVIIGGGDRPDTWRIADNSRYTQNTWDEQALDSERRTTIRRQCAPVPGSDWVQ